MLSAKSFRDPICLRSSIGLFTPIRLRATAGLRSILSTLALLLLTPLVVGCGGSEVENAEGSSSLQSKTPPTVLISPGADAQTKALEALILAKPGDIIEFGAGTFDFDSTLSLDGVDKVTVRGAGIFETILNFSGMQSGSGGEGLKVRGNDFRIENLTIEDTPGDAIKLQDSNGVTMNKVRTWWSKGPSTENGAYGLYPVLCTNVLIEHCVAQGASDAGIYVGQSKQVIVRHCKADQNVAGIEIENCIGADVYENEVHNNTGGILVFSLPGLTIKNGSDCRVFNNKLTQNNHRNFAKEGAIVSTVPPGTGMMVMANDRVEVFDNQFSSNHGAHCLIVSFLVSQRKFDDKEYDPFPEAISIRNNSFEEGGSDAKGEFLEMYCKATKNRLPDIVFDGIFDERKLVDGKLPATLTFSITENPDAQFVNLDLGKMFAGEQPVFDTDLSEFSKPLDPVAPVKFPFESN